MTTWSAWSYAGNNGLRVGIDLAVSGTTITANYYVDNEYSYAQSGMVISFGGGYAGAAESFSAYWSNGSGPHLVSSHTVSGGLGQTVTFSASISGAYNGSAPSVSASITVPGGAPSAPGRPSVSNVTASSATFAWSAPSSWGGQGGSYTVQVATNSAFTGGVTKSQVGSPYTWGGLVANTAYWVRVRADNGAGSSSWSAASSFTTGPNAPAAPTGLTVTRVSDTQQKLAWTNHATAQAPYASTAVQRAPLTTAGAAGTWVTVASLGATATSYTDTSTKPDTAYAYRIAAFNSGAGRASDTVSPVHTTPAAPTNVQAAKTSTGDITVSWSSAPGDVDARPVVRHSTDGGATWAEMATLGSRTATTWTHTSPSSTAPHLYQVAVRVSAGVTSEIGHGLTSSWTSSNVVQLLAPPNPPTGLSPNGGVADAARPIGLSWQHNPVDSSPQRQWQGQHRPAGTTAWVQTPVMTSSSWTIPAGQLSNGGTEEWQVRTWGNFTDPSPWSATATIQLRTTPTVTINDPDDGSTVSSSTLVVTWGYDQAEGSPQVGWRCTWQSADGSQQGGASGADDSSQTTITGLTDQTSYLVQVQVQAATGVWSDPDQATITVSYLPPARVDLTAQLDPDSGAMVLQLSPEAADGTTTVPVTGALIDRRINSGPWVRITPDVVDPSTTVLDLTCPVGDVVVEYAVIGFSDTPSSSVNAPVQADTSDPGLWSYLSGGPQFDQVAKLWANIDDTTSDDLDRAVQQFAGRVLPVEMTGTAVTASIDITGVLTEDASTPDDLRALGRLPGIMLWRDPTGRQFFGSISAVKIQERTPTPHSSTVQFSLTQVDHADPIDTTIVLPSDIVTVAVLDTV